LPSHLFTKIFIIHKHVIYSAIGDSQSELSGFPCPQTLGERGVWNRQGHATMQNEKGEEGVAGPRPRLKSLHINSIDDPLAV